MVIYMRHAIHGNKVAVAEEEAKADEEKGWERYSLDAPVCPIDTELIELRLKYQEQFGKKPHHKKSVEALKQELAA